MQLGGKVALVTGAGSGIARATALMMAREGAEVVAVGLGRVGLDKVVREIETGGGHAVAVEPMWRTAKRCARLSTKPRRPLAAWTSCSPTPA